MAQQLQLPFHGTRMTAGYKNAAYKARFGFTHYGVDLVSTDGSRNIQALGEGDIIAAGQDGPTLTGVNSRMGNCVVVVYKDVACNDGAVRSLACRMFHMDSIRVKAGDKVKAGDVIGVYGNTGAYSTGAHLHIEFDTDIKYPQHAMGLASGGNIIKRGTVDSTVNPTAIWRTGPGQQIAVSGDAYTTAADKAIPAMTADVSPESPAENQEDASLQEQIDALREEIRQIKEKLAAL